MLSSTPPANPRCSSARRGTRRSARGLGKNGWTRSRGSWKGRGRRRRRGARYRMVATRDHVAARIPVDPRGSSPVIVPHTNPHFPYIYIYIYIHVLQDKAWPRSKRRRPSVVPTAGGAPEQNDLRALVLLCATTYARSDVANTCRCWTPPRTSTTKTSIHNAPGVSSLSSSRLMPLPGIPAGVRSWLPSPISTPAPRSSPTMPAA